MSQVIVETLHIIEEQLQGRALGGTQTTSAATQTSGTTSAPSPTMSGNPNSGGTSSPLLFFVALGFGVVFTNLWIIVGVKYCFRYNARNRAIRNGEDPDPIGLDNMPPRPHRRRREKKLMTMDEVNLRFPLTKYRAWVKSRASKGLPAEGGIAATPSRAVSLRNADGVLPTSPVDTKHSIDTRPATAVSVPPTTEVNAQTKTDAEKAAAPNPLVQVQTTASTVDKHATRNSEDEDDEDDHIHTAVPPELLTNPGDACAICIDTLEDDDDIRGLECGHAFHAGCLDPWLTSRRACCPLCKADYYTPKPRPEGEPVENTRPLRRAHRNPTQPASTWTRGGLMRVRHADGASAGAAANPPLNGGAPVDGVAQPGSVANTSRWRPRNPFSNIHLPGRNRPQNLGHANAEPSPSQLEAGRAGPTA